MTRAYTNMPLPDRFWVRVAKADGDGCWLWTGNKMSFGYGRLMVNRKMIGAHRYSYELAHGPIADGVVIRHSCDNPPCVNPAHLIAGTQSDNVHDMLERGRHVTPFVRTNACKNGHEWTSESTRYEKDGARACRTCERNHRDTKRGHPPIHFNAAKTHCPQGHEYTPGNTVLRKRGRCRECRTCTRIQQRIRRARFDERHGRATTQTALASPFRMFGARVG